MSVCARFVLILVFSLGFLGAGGCSSKKTIEATSAEAVIAGVNKGDQVVITTRNDSVEKFKVTKITNKALYGNSARVVYEDMQKVVVTKKADDDEDDEEGGFFSWLF